jgi:hypothetical protein
MPRGLSQTRVWNPQRRFCANLLRTCAKTELREEWVRRITESWLLTAITREEIFAEATSVYDKYVAVPESGSVEALQAYARDLSERIIPRGVETHEVVGIVLLLRDVLARSLFKKYQSDFGLLNLVLDALASTHGLPALGTSLMQPHRNHSLTPDPRRDRQGAVMFWRRSTRS